MFMSVDLPLPDFPTKNTMPRAGSTKLTPSKALTSGREASYILTSFSALIISLECPPVPPSYAWEEARGARMIKSF